MEQQQNVNEVQKEMLEDVKVMVSTGLVEDKYVASDRNVGDPLEADKYSGWDENQDAGLMNAKSWINPEEDMLKQEKAVVEEMQPQGPASPKINAKQSSSEVDEVEQSSQDLLIARDDVDGGDKAFPSKEEFRQQQMPVSGYVDRGPSPAKEDFSKQLKGQKTSPDKSRKEELAPEMPVDTAAELDKAETASFSGRISGASEPLPVGLIPLSGPVHRSSHSGPIPFSGNLSLRSDSSTTSTRSFAFPILTFDWNSSPAKMAPPDKRYNGRRSCFWRWFCCLCSAKYE